MTICAAVAREVVLTVGTCGNTSPASGSA